MGCSTYSKMWEINVNKKFYHCINSLQHKEETVLGHMHLIDNLLL